MFKVSGCEKNVVFVDPLKSVYSFYKRRREVYSLLCTCVQGDYQQRLLSSSITTSWWNMGTLMHHHFWTTASMSKNSKPRVNQSCSLTQLWLKQPHLPILKTPLDFVPDKPASDLDLKAFHIVKTPLPLFTYIQNNTFRQHTSFTDKGVPYLRSITSNRFRKTLLAFPSEVK